MDRLLYALVGLALGAVAMVCWPQPARPVPTTNIDELKQPRPGIAPGYLARDSLVDSLALLPPPAPDGSALQAADDESRRAAVAARGTARWKLAARDGDFKFPAAGDAFACTLGVRIDAAQTPHLVMLLRRSLTDARLATNRAKDTYNRLRPFAAANDDAICAPQEGSAQRKDGSYPSGHAAVGWAWGLILAELAPERADALIRRGFDYGQSRVVCGVHWQSDVDAGRLVAAAVVAQLHASPDFQAQLDAARKEVAAARAAAKPAPDCALEQQAAAR